MKQKCLLFLLGLLLVLFTQIQSVEAASDCGFTHSFDKPLSPQSINFEFQPSLIEQEKSRFPPGGSLQFFFPDLSYDLSIGTICPLPAVPKHTITYAGIFDTCGAVFNRLLHPGSHAIEITYTFGNRTETICTGAYAVEAEQSSCKVEVKHTGDGSVLDDSWNIVVSDINLISPHSAVRVSVDEISGDPLIPTTPGQIFENPLPIETRTVGTHDVTVFAGNIQSRGSFNEQLQICNATIRILSEEEAQQAAKICSNIPIPARQAARECQPPYEICSWCSGKQSQLLPKLRPLCEQIDEQFRSQCESCNSQGKIWTAIGCLPTDFSVIIKDVVFKTGIGIAGGVAFLYFLYGAFLILTSTGNPEVIAQGKQVITSALSGLLLIIFSIFFLRVIGIDILGLNALGWG